MHSDEQSADSSSLFSTQKTDPLVVSAYFVWTEGGEGASSPLEALTILASFYKKKQLSEGREE